MKADEIARYLQDHPKFFEEYADLLAQLYIPHPHGGRAISITERQILTLREKAKLLEGKLGELIRFGEENDAIGEKVHRLATALAGARDFAAARQALFTHLGEDFAVPHVAFRLWSLPAQADAAEFAPEVNEQTRIFAAGLAHPFCGANAGFEAAGLVRRGRRAGALRGAGGAAARCRDGRRPAGPRLRGRAALLSPRWARCTSATSETWRARPC